MSQKHKRHVVGMFDSVESLEYKVFAKVASLLRDDCIFHSAIGFVLLCYHFHSFSVCLDEYVYLHVRHMFCRPVSEEHRVAGNKIVFKPPGVSIAISLYER